MEINFDSPKKIVLRPEDSITVDKLTIERIVDFPGEKVVRCFVSEIQGPVVLWKGDSYDSIGQWTDTDVQNRLIEIYNL